jgi:hypothetical protein
MKVRRQDFGKSRPVLKAVDLGDADSTVVTIATVEEVEKDKQNLLAMTFDEWPEHSYFPNVTSIGNLTDYLGEESDDWIGEKIVLEVVKTNNPQTKKAADGLWVAAASEQKELLAQAKGTRRVGRPKEKARRK